MPIRHGGRLASRASTWPRDHFWRSTRAPRRSWPTMWNEFLPISMPITAILLLSFSDMACSFVFGAPCQFGSLAGLEHGRTIPFPDILGVVLHRIGVVNGTDFRVMNDPGRVEPGGAAQQRRDQTSQLNGLPGVHG